MSVECGAREGNDCLVQCGEREGDCLSSVALGREFAGWVVVIVCRVGQRGIGCLGEEGDVVAHGKGRRGGERAD